MTPLDQTAQLAARPAHLAHPAGPAASLGRSLPFPVPPTRVGTGARPRRTPSPASRIRPPRPPSPRSRLPLAPALPLGLCASPVRSTSLSPSIPTARACSPPFTVVPAATVPRLPQRRARTAPRRRLRRLRHRERAERLCTDLPELVFNLRPPSFVADSGYPAPSPSSLPLPTAPL